MGGKRSADRYPVRSKVSAMMQTPGSPTERGKGGPTATPLACQKESPMRSQKIMDRISTSKAVLESQLELINKNTLEHRHKEAVRVANVEEHLVVLEEDTKKHLAEVRDELKAFREVYDGKINKLKIKWDDTLAVQAKEEDVVISSMEESCKKIVKELDTLFKYQEGVLEENKVHLRGKIEDLKKMLDEEKQDTTNRATMAKKRLDKYLQQMQDKIDASAEELEQMVGDVRTEFDQKFLALTHKTDTLHHNVLSQLMTLKAQMKKAKEERVAVHETIVDSVNMYGAMMNSTFKIITEKR